ncbi:MAG: C40 family peptidase [Elusimicrobia bacterium]|nr:C40 family peptidase [Elusimicrobiota bacterium]
MLDERSSTYYDLSVRLKKLLFIAALATIPKNCLHAKSVAQARNQIVETTLRYLNVPYLWGGEHPVTGLDCSGFIRLVYQQAGLSLPRTSREQFQSTKKLSPGHVLPGDIIFFSMKHPGSTFVDHVGIYVGKGYFIHASATNGVHLEAITKPYYWNRLISVRKHTAL